MAAIKREQAEWITQFLDTDIESVLKGFGDVSDDDDGPAAGDSQDDNSDDTADEKTGADPDTEESDQDAQTADDPAPAQAAQQPGPDGDPASDATTAGTPDAEPVGTAGSGQEKGLASPLPVAAGPAIPVALLIAGAQYLTRELVANVTVTNNTEETLTLDQGGAQMAHGELKGKKPKASLAPKESDTFAAHSSSLLSVLDGIPVLEWLSKGVDKLIGSPSLGGVEGTLRYLVGDAGTSWTCHFVYPRMITSSKEGKGVVAGQNPSGATDQSQQPGDDDKWSFVLLGKGGGGGQSAGAVTVRVSVINSSDQTIFLRHQDNIGGEFTTNPKTKLGPGEQDSFLYGATAGDKTRACRGKLFYDVADPKLVEWELLWDNQVNAKNLSASFLNPKDNTSGLHTLDQIDNGDENVPATYTLSGKGGGGPVPGQGGQFAVTMDNKTDAELTLTNSSATGGALAPNPPAKLAAGASAKLQFTPDPAAKGSSFSAIWAVGSSGTSWFTKGTIPAGGGDPTAEGPLNPTNDALSATATATKTADGGTFAFAVSGTVAPSPDQPDDKFVPPPKGKQPTLRKGDNNSDGWVEYAQQLINAYGLGPKLPIDGDFSPAMDKLVRDVQTQLQCQSDGVIGNETWSALREGPREHIGTDGRKPHTFEEKGPQARFFTEKGDFVNNDAPSDFYGLTIISTGEQPIDTFNATMEVTQPSGTSHTHKTTIGKSFQRSPDGQGDLHGVQFQPFSKIFKLETGVTADMCTIDVYLDGEIGGDRVTIPPKVQPK